MSTPILTEHGGAVAISAMPVEADPPAPGVLVPVVVPSTASPTGYVNAHVPVSWLLTTGTGEQIVIDSGAALTMETRGGANVRMLPSAGGGILLSTVDNQVVNLTDGGNVTVSSPTGVDIQVTGGPSIQLTPSAVLVDGLPAGDPHIPGALWSDPAAGYVLKISQG